MKQEMKKAIWVLSGLMVIVAFFAGCAAVTDLFGPYYQEGVMNNKKLQEGHIREAAKSSQDIGQFAAKIYAKPLKPMPDGSILIDKRYSRQQYDNYSNYYDTTIFSLYCSEKGGTRYVWQVHSDWFTYSGVSGMNKTFYTCEIAGKVNTVLAYETYLRDVNYKGPAPYEQQRLLASGEYFYDLVKKSKLEGYVSSNRMIAIPMTRIAETNGSGNSGSEVYPFLFDYKNEEHNPVSIDMLNSSVSVNGTKYNIDFKYSGKPIYWQDTRDYNSTGIFVGGKGETMSKLRLNPGQRLSGQVICKIPGLQSVRTEDLAHLTFTVDAFRCEGFRKMSLYDLQKDKI